MSADPATFEACPARMMVLRPAVTTTDDIIYKFLITFGAIFEIELHLLNILCTWGANSFIWVRLLTIGENMDINELAHTNAAYIQRLNNNINILQQNIETILTANKETTRDLIALQKAVLQFLAAKKIIENEEDIRLFQKLHMQNIFEEDQRMAERRDSDTNET